jgi:hypothetical protein
MKLVEISQELLKASKCLDCVTPLLNQISTVSLSDLNSFLDTDEKKKAFWINIYNSYTTIYLKPKPEVILKSISRILFFNKKIIHFKNCSFTLNEIELDIIRKSKIWWSKGYLSKVWIKPCFNQLRVQKLDVRIHFALNCGGLGCPPIRFYDANSIDEQLEVATHSFLFSEVKKETNTLNISKLFNWYIGDFGGKTGLIRFFQKYNVLSSEDNNPKIKYFEYNWEPWIK